MQSVSVQSLILSALGELPGQMQVAAKALLDRPDDAALLSMREFARQAGVQPATLTRLAQRLGFEGYEGLQRRFADVVRGRDDTFEQRAEGLIARRDLDGDSALAVDTIAGVAGHLKALANEQTLSAIAQAADLIVGGKRVFCVGARSSFAAMYLGSYLLALVGEDSRLVDGAGGIGFDRLHDLGRDDVVLALSIQPYTRSTVDAAAFAVERRAALIAVTDSIASPIARNARAAIIVPTETPSFLQTMTPAIVVVECLAALVAAKRGRSAARAIARSEQHLERFSSYVGRRAPKRETSRS